MTESGIVVVRRQNAGVPTATIAVHIDGSIVRKLRPGHTLALVPLRPGAYVVAATTPVRFTRSDPLTVTVRLGTWTIVNIETGTPTWAMPRANDFADPAQWLKCSVDRYEDSVANLRHPDEGLPLPLVSLPMWHGLVFLVVGGGALAWTIQNGSLVQIVAGALAFLVAIYIFISLVRIRLLVGNPERNQAGKPTAGGTSEASD